MFTYWNVTSLINGKKGYHFQIVLKEGSTDILFNYEEVYSGGPDTVMVGIENSDGSIGLRYPGFDTGGEFTKRSVLFYKDSAPSPIYYDRDGDGYTSDVDCNDYNAAIHPGAVEICDGVDNDCDGIVDEGCNNLVDNDGDGYYSNNDCNDYNAAIHPGAIEICDGVDNDCDGIVDEGCGTGGDVGGEPDAFGYRYITSDESGGPEYKWEYFSDKAQRLTLNADDGLVNAIPMGFFYDAESTVKPYFEFYGKQYNNIYIAGNGYLTFTPDSKYTNFAYDGQGFPVVGEPHNLVAPLWVGGQSPEEAGLNVEVIYETFGFEPQRHFVMQFKRNTLDSSQQIAYQVVFYEQENTIQFNYQSIPSLEADFQVAGISNGDSTIGLRYAGVGEAEAITNRSVLFYLGDPPVGIDPDPDPGSDPEPGRANLYMPLVVNGNWQTSVVLLNDSGSETVTGILQGHDAMGNVVAFSENIVLAPLARQEGSLKDFFGEFDGNIAYLTFTANIDAVVGSVHLRVEGQGLGGAYPALSHAAAGETIYLPMVLTQDGWGNLLSLMNADNENSYAKIEFNNGASASVFFQPGQHVLIDLAQLTVLTADHRRVLLKDTTPEPMNAVISGGNGLLGAVLYYQGVTLGVAALNGSAGEQVVYPYLPDSVAWWGGITLYNPQLALIDTTLSGYLSDGEPADLTITDVPLGFMQSQSFQTVNLLPNDSGWLLAESISPITGMEFFGTVDGKQMALVSTSELRGPSGVFPRIHAGDAGVWSGLVLINPGEVENQVTLIAYDDSGRTQGETRKMIPAHGQIVNEVTSLFDPANIDNATFIRFVADSEIVSLLFNGHYYKVGDYPLSELEALPPLRLATTGDRY